MVEWGIPENILQKQIYSNENETENEKEIYEVATMQTWEEWT